MKESEYIESFLRYLRESESNLRMAQESEIQCNNETQDVLHRLELCDDNYRNTALIAKKLRQIRKDRRTAKNRVEIFTPVAEWVSENQAAIRSLEATLGQMRKIEKQQQIRVYVPRTDVFQESLVQNEKK